MSRYSVLQVGLTGPEGRMGSGTGYHIDSKYRKDLPWKDKVAAFDAKAGKYKELGRNIVFSNEGVSGLVYDPSASMEDKISMLQRVSAAHTHSPNTTFDSFDYFAPKGTDVWDPSAEGAPIFLAGPSGAKAQGGSGGGYGNFAWYDIDGVQIGKVGHGDTNEAVFSGGVFGGGNGDPSQPSPTADLNATPSSGVPSTPAGPLTPQGVNEKYDKLRMAGDIFKAEEFGMAEHKRLFNK